MSPENMTNFVDRITFVTPFSIKLFKVSKLASCQEKFVWSLFDRTFPVFLKIWYSKTIFFSIMFSHFSKACIVISTSYNFWLNFFFCHFRSCWVESASGDRGSNPRVCMFSLCTPGFSLGTQVSTHSPKTCS